MPRVFIIFFNFWIFFALFFLLETLYHCHKTDSSHLLKKRSMNHRESFQRKAYDSNGLDNFFSHFPFEFLVFACICCNFHNPKAYCDVLLMTHE